MAALSPVRAFAQQPPAPPGGETPARRFEVVSVRPNTGSDMVMRLDVLPGGRFIALNTPLRQLIAAAYGIDERDLTGGPPWMNNSLRSAGWVNNDRFDVIAQADGELPPWSHPFAPELQLMLRTLLEERFGLVVRTDTREVPGFTLVRARSDGRLGPALTPAAVDCAALQAERSPADGPAPCGLRVAPGTIVLEGVPIASLATALTNVFGRPVTDGTGLAGPFDLQLSWDMPPAAADGAGVPTRADALVDALRARAALALEPSTHTATALVVETVRRPDPN